MKKFESVGKINFVDENNVFVGYDLNQECSEHVDWFVSKQKPKSIANTKDFNFDDYVFDKNFFEQNIIEQSNNNSEASLYSIIFRLIGKDNKEAYLCLFNCHNGYYGHGFNMSIDGQEIHSGKI